MRTLYSPVPLIPSSSALGIVRERKSSALLLEEVERGRNESNSSASSLSSVW